MVDQPQTHARISGGRRFVKPTHVARRCRPRCDTDQRPVVTELPKQQCDQIGITGRDGPERQQRVAVARALVSRPQIVFADEPTGNLDSKTSQQIVRLLANLRAERGLTVVMISHEEALLREFADRMVYLQDGAVVSQEVVRDGP